MIETRPARYLVVDGRGGPGETVFQDRVGALYGVGYTVKFNSKFAGGDYVVGKLEGLWGVRGQTAADLAGLPKSEWNWRLMMRVPEFIGDEQIVAARKMLREKGKEGDFDAVTLETIDEGLCVQILHVGPYEDEHRTIETMKSFAVEQGCEPNLWHHEIYLSDPRRVPPEKLRTILRQPVRRS